VSGSLNRVQLIGHLGADPDVRRTQDGRAIVNMRLATSEQWRDKNSGERKERTEWHTVVVFSEHAAKFCEQYAKKGSYLLVEGQLQTRKWQAQDGSDRWSTEVVINNFGGTVTSLDKAPSNRPPPAGDASDYGRTTTRQQNRDPAPNYSRDMDDGIPF
jgi:single-strand DNA-binding protein